jgi:hypothetical protein
MMISRRHFFSSLFLFYLDICRLIRYDEQTCGDDLAFPGYRVSSLVAYFERHGR